MAAPCELMRGGILREWHIFGQTIERPLFEVIQLLSIESLTRDFWVNRLRPMFFSQLIEIDNKNGNDNNVLFTIMVVLTHFPDALYGKSGIDLDTLYDDYHRNMTSRTKKILVSACYIQAHANQKNVKKTMIDMINMKQTGNLFQKDDKIIERIARVEESLVCS
ncbi:MAG: hypothetical protein K9M36_00290 [Candidatus Pacebacteria bacterium]|nr:hypothetical protein [Candidatus Paceibacterota bacterium]